MSFLDLLPALAPAVTDAAATTAQQPIQSSPPLTEQQQATATDAAAPANQPITIDDRDILSKAVDKLGDWLEGSKQLQSKAQQADQQNQSASSSQRLLNSLGQTAEQSQQKAQLATQQQEQQLSASTAQTLQAGTNFARQSMSDTNAMAALNLMHSLNVLAPLMTRSY